LFLDYQPLAELGHSLSAADLHLLPLSSSLARCLMPSKLYGILAAGRPYLTNAPVGTELHELTVHHRLGLTVQAGSAGEIADAIKGVVSTRSELIEMGNNGRRLAEARFTPHHSLSAFREVLSAVLAERTRC
jgi:glycosyltransferase involved in cell wall biosynthesis